MEADWKKFRAIVPQLRERYLAEKNRQLLTSLADPQKTHAERFWDTFARMEEEAEILRTCLDGHSRSNMIFHLTLMLRHGLLRSEDLRGFSPELQKRIEAILD